MKTKVTKKIGIKDQGILGIYTAKNAIEIGYINLPKNNCDPKSQNYRTLKYRN